MIKGEMMFWIIKVIKFMMTYILLQNIILLKKSIIENQ